MKVRLPDWLRTVLCTLAVVSAAAGAPGVDHLAKGNDHYFNLEYDEAIEAYNARIERDGVFSDAWRKF